jgi:tetratricopeptide (TPR) repeat protein
VSRTGSIAGAVGAVGAVGAAEAPADLVARATADPAGTEPLARARAEAARAAGDAAGEAVARRALALCLRFQLRLGEALHALDRAETVAAMVPEPATSRDLLADVLLSRAFVHAVRGDEPRALADLYSARPLARGDRRAVLWLQEAGVLGVLGRDREALEPASRAVAWYRRRGDWLNLGRTLQTRALRLQAIGEVARAKRDHAEAIEAYERAGHRAGAAMSRFNLAVVVALAGDLPDALRRFDEADAELAAVGVDPAGGVIGRFEALFRANLAEEALAVARAGAARLDEAGAPVLAAQARVNLARAAARLGRRVDAATAARAAIGTLPVDSPWSELAWVVLGDVAPESTSAAEIARRAQQLERRGWLVAALEGLLVAARAAAVHGDHDLADTLLARAGRSPHRGVVEARLLALQASAASAARRGRPLDALGKARTGMELLAGHRRGLAAADLRIASAVHGSELVATGTAAALSTGDADTVLAWLHTVADARVRSTTGGSRSGSSASLVAALRAVSSRVERLALDGSPVPSALVQRQADIEAELLALDRRATASGRRAAGRRRPPARPVAVLLESGGRLHALRVDPAGRPSLRSDLASVATVAALVERLRILVGAVAAGRTGGRVVALIETGRRLDAILAPAFAADRDDEPDDDRDPGAAAGPGVIVPSASLAGLPWGLVASAAACVVAPTFDHTRTGTRTGGLRSGAAGTVAFAGPALRAASGEARAVARQHREAVALTGRHASAASLAAAFGAASLLHVAAHVRPRHDAPSSTTILCSDGPLLLRELDDQGVRCETVVLAACDAGSTTDLAGQDVLGATVHLLDLGVRSAVAPVVAIDDTATRPVMRRFHEELAAGRSAPVALDRARRSIDWDTDPVAAAVAAGFVCFGRV